MQRRLTNVCGLAGRLSCSLSCVLRWSLKFATLSNSAHTHVHATAKVHVCTLVRVLTQARVRACLHSHAHAHTHACTSCACALHAPDLKNLWTPCKAFSTFPLFAICKDVCLVFLCKDVLFFFAGCLAWLS